jgi:hypothetical protein
MSVLYRIIKNLHRNVMLKSSDGVNDRVTEYIIMVQGQSDAHPFYYNCNRNKGAKMQANSRIFHLIQD